MKIKLATIVVAVLEARAIAAPSAKDLYDQGQAAYNNAAYAMAVAKWTQSYELSGAPDLLFNIGQAHRLDGDCVHALSSYKRFVEVDPKSEQRALADDIIRELEPTCGAPTRAPSVARPSTKPGRTLKGAGLVTGGAGTVLVMTGLLFGRRGSTLGDEVSRTCSQGCDWGEQRSKDAAGRRYASIGYALDGIGIAAIAAGGVMYYLGESAVTVAPRPSDGGAVVTWSGTW